MIFCGSKDVPVSVEDVIPRWAEGLRYQGPLTVSASDRPGERHQVGRRTDVLRVVLRDALCERCNSGWLGGTVEKPAARLLAPMAVRRKPRILDAIDERLAAFWAGKTVFWLELGIRQMYPGQREVEGDVPREPELAWLCIQNEPDLWRWYGWVVGL